MVAPIFKFRNVRMSVTTATPTFIYGVVPYDSTMPTQTLASGVSSSEVSVIVLTIQVSNITGSNSTVPAAQTVATSVGIWNSTTPPTTLDTADANYYSLVSNYPLIAQNSVDPLSGNLVLGAGDQIWVTTDVANSVDVIVSLMEISNASAI